MQVDRGKRCFSAQRFIRKSRNDASDCFADESITQLVRFAYDPAHIPKRASAGHLTRNTNPRRILLRSKKPNALTEPELRPAAQIIRFPVQPRR